MSIVDPLPAGALTWGGKTQGPAINMGRVRPHMVGGRMFYLHLDELRDCVVKAGWHTEEDYQRLLTGYAELEEKFKLLQAQLTDALVKANALETAIGWKPAEKPKQVVHSKKPVAAK